MWLVSGDVTKFGMLMNEDIWYLDGDLSHVHINIFLFIVQEVYDWL